MGSLGVWIAFLLAEILTLVTAAALIARRNGKLPRRLEDLLLLPDEFGRQDRRVDFSISNDLKQVGQISQRLGEYCSQRNVPEKLTQQLSLCLEEMAANVVQHAFTPGRRQWMDISIIDRGKYLFLSIRDNGRPFDPVSHDPEPEQYGLRLVRAMAREFAYSRSLDRNVVTIRLDKYSGQP